MWTDLGREQEQGQMFWEYTTHKMSISGFFVTGDVNSAELNNALNWYGQQGWELVSAFDTNGGHGGSQYLLLIFKRPVAASRPAGAVPPPLVPQRTT